MPNYNFECRSCLHQTEEFYHKITEFDSHMLCTKCGKHEVRQILVPGNGGFRWKLSMSDINDDPVNFWKRKNIYERD